MDGLLHGLDADGTQIWKSTEVVFEDGAGQWPTGVAVADLDRDGTVEVVAGTKVFSGKNGTKKFSVPQGTGFSTIADTDGKSGIEIITSLGIYSGDDGTKICSFPLPIEDPAVATLRKDDVRASVIGVVKNEIVTFDGGDCTVKARVTKPSQGGGPLNIADFNGDGVLDFGTAGIDQYMAFNGKGGVLWSAKTQDRSSQVTGSTTFDFNGDGKNEIVYADEIKLRILNGEDGRLVFEAPHASFTARETPVVVDVDGDGIANVVIADNSCLAGAADFSGIRAFKEPNNEWTGTRPIWNQHGYSALLVKDSGSLININAKSIYKPWLSSEHLAGFRNNIPRIAIKKECK